MDCTSRAVSQLGSNGRMLRERQGQKAWRLTSLEAVSKPEEDSGDVGDDDNAADVCAVSDQNSQMTLKDGPCEKPDESLPC